MTVFWDTGSNKNLFRNKSAEESGWQGTPVVQSLTIAGGDNKEWSTMLYTIPLIMTNGTMVNIKLREWMSTQTNRKKLSREG